MAGLVLTAWTFISTHQSEVAVIVLVLLAVYKLLVYPFLISPLRHVPGPYICRVSPIPRLWGHASYLWVRRVHSLHQRYGDVVIISPKEVALNGSRFLADLYVRNMEKLSFYESFKAHGHNNLFSTLDNKSHLKHRKVLKSIYSKTALSCNFSTKEIILTQVANLVRQIYECSVWAQTPDYFNARLEFNPHGKGFKQGSSSWLRKKTMGMGVDVYLLFGAMAMDAISAFELGPANGTHMLEEPNQRLALIQHREQVEQVLWCSILPSFISKWIPKSTEAAVENWLLGLYEAPKEAFPANTTLFSLLKRGYSTLLAYSFASDNIIAGHETTAFLLTYVCYELSRPVHKDRQTRLRNELRNAFGAPSSVDDLITDFEKVEALPYLDAVLRENFRVHTSGPGFLPRVTSDFFKVDIQGRPVRLPPGTTVSCQQHLLHRQESIFPQPDLYLPERWLQDVNELDEDYKRRVVRMKSNIMLFGKGVRMCLGMNFAISEIKMALANLFWRFESNLCLDWCDISVYDSHTKNGKPINLVSGKPKGTSDEDMMSMVDNVSTRGCYDECWLEWNEA